MEWRREILMRPTYVRLGDDTLLALVRYHAPVNVAIDVTCGVLVITGQVALARRNPGRRHFNSADIRSKDIRVE